MATAVTGTNGTTGTSSTGSAGDVFSNAGSDMFLKLLVAQMKYQNPMSPSDPTAMMGQIAQYAQVEALNKLQTLQASGNSLTQAQMATSMIGQDVSALDSTGATVTGKVTAARFTDAGPVLVLDTGAELSVSAVGKVGSTVAAANSGATPSTSTPSSSTPSSTPSSSTPSSSTPTDTSSSTDDSSTTP